MEGLDGNGGGLNPYAYYAQEQNIQVEEVHDPEGEGEGD
jgi:hypothetical protein